MVLEVLGKNLKKHEKSGLRFCGFWGFLDLRTEKKVLEK